MIDRRSLGVPLALFCLTCLLAKPARAYNEALHALLASRAFTLREAWLREPVGPVREADLAALRAAFWQAGAGVRDPALRARFLALYPRPDALSAWEFKELLMLDPAARVHGIDPADDLGPPVSRGALLALASRWPDDDLRNQNRFLRDARHEIVRGPDGEPLPDDPATLDLGGLRGTSSQAHAHYALMPGPLSSDPAVLQSDPRRFAVPADAHTFGATFVQIYTDLALLAGTLPEPGRSGLQATFAGAAFHHLEDVSNQIHTVQVGIYDFFKAAFVQSKLRDVRTLGGLLGQRRTLRELGVHIISNHHLLTEDLFARRIQAELALPGATGPAIAEGLRRLSSDEPSLLSTAPVAVERAGGARGPFGRALAEAVVELSSREGPEVYQLAWSFGAPALRDGAGREYRGGLDDPDEWIALDSPAAQDAFERFQVIQMRGLQRAATALRLWQAWFEAARADDPATVDVRAVERLLSVLLPLRAQAEARRAAYRATPPEHPGVAWGYPVAALLLLGILSWAVAALLRRKTRNDSSSPEVHP